MKRNLRWTALVLCMVVLLNACGTAAPTSAPAEASSSDSTQSEVRSEPEDTGTAAAQSAKSAEPYTPSGIDASANVLADEFAVRLLQLYAQREGGVLLSPISILSALGTAELGAQGDTLAQMESVTGFDRSTLSDTLYLYRSMLEESDAAKLASAVWVRNDGHLAVNEDFLSSAASRYDAEIYQAAFQPELADTINQWVSDETDGMIDSIVDEIPENAMMYLVNALAFRAEWQEPYETSDVYDDTFTKDDGTQQQVSMMSSTEDIYLEDENTTGLIKYYDGNRYAFAALLPQEGISIEDYVNSLSGEKLSALLENACVATVNAGIPKFEVECELQLSDALSGLGMTDAFDPQKADFGAMGTSPDGNLCISSVLHRTYLKLNETGTEAAAATSIEMVAECALDDESESYRVYLNRPFVYLIIDTEYQMPLFIGTVTGF